jgi:hypothetical protein
MTRRILLGFFILPVVALLLPYSPVDARPRVAPVYKPDVIKVSGMSYSQVKKEVRKALFSRGWQMKEIKKGLIRATYTKSSKRTSLKAVVNIHFTKKSVRINYYASEGFSYNKGAGTIATRFNSWVRNIEKDIRLNLGSF